MSSSTENNELAQTRSSFDDTSCGNTSIFTPERLETIVNSLELQTSNNEQVANGELQYRALVPTIIYANTADNVMTLSSLLRKNYNISCVAYHKQMKYEDKLNALSSFKDGLVSVIVSTDASARY
jgi:superfamily II DNA/RNA helicase